MPLGCKDIKIGRSMFEAIVFMYSENQKTVDDFKTQVMTLNYPIEMKKIKCAV